MYRLRSNAYSRRLRTQKHVLRLAARKKEMKKKGADSASIKKAVEEEEKAASMEAEKDIVEVIHRVEKAGEESSEAGASVSTIEMQLKAILEGQVALAQSGAAERARMDAELAKMEEERVKERERLEEEIEKLRAEAAARAENEIALGSPGKVDPEEIKRESMRKVEDEISEKRDKLEKQHIQEEMDALEKNITAKEEAAESAADIAAREAKEREEAKLKEKLENIKSQNEWFEKMGKAELNVKKEAQKKKLEERRAKLKLKKEREQLQKRQEEERMNLKLEQEEAMIIGNLSAGSSSDPSDTSREPWEEKLAEVIHSHSADATDGVDWESSVIAVIAESDFVPDVMIQTAVQRVFASRHARETSAMLSGQYRERSGLLRKALNEVFDEKSAQRKKILCADLSEQVRSEKLARLDEDFLGKREEAEKAVQAECEEAHMEVQLALRSRQLGEIRNACLAISDKSEKELEIDAKRAAEKIKERQETIEREKREKIAKLEEEKVRQMEDIERKTKLELERMEKENLENLEKEKIKAAEALEERKKRMEEAHRLEMEQKMAEMDNSANEEEKEKLKKQFEEDHKKVVEEMDNKAKEQKGKLEEKLRKRKERKRLMLEEKKRKELLNKETNLDKKISVLEGCAKGALEVSKAEGAMISSVDKDVVRGAKSRWLKGGKLVKNVLMLKKKGFMSEKTDLSGGSLGERKAGGAPPAWVMEKLEGIEGMLRTIEKYRSTEKNQNLQDDSYQDPQDVMLLPVHGSKLEKLSDMSVADKMWLKEARRVLKILGMDKTMRIVLAKSLPINTFKNSNAFKNSCRWDASVGELYVHSGRVGGADRVGGGGDLTLLLVHTVSHIKTHGGDMANWSDSSPAFVAEFYRNLRTVAGELLKGGEAKRLGSVRSVSNIDIDLDSNSDAGSKSKFKDDEFFTRENLAERMKKYAAGITGGEEMVARWGRGRGGATHAQPHNK